MVEVAAADVVVASLEPPLKEVAAEEEVAESSPLLEGVVRLNHLFFLGAAAAVVVAVRGDSGYRAPIEIAAAIDVPLQSNDCVVLVRRGFFGGEPLAAQPDPSRGGTNGPLKTVPRPRAWLGRQLRRPPRKTFRTAYSKPERVHSSAIQSILEDLQ